MHAAPAVHVRVGDRGIWPAAVALASLASGAVCAAWLVGMAADWPSWWSALAAAGCSAILLQALGASRVHAKYLRWDTQAWQVQPRGGGEPVAGGITVALDFGTWMLLRFDAVGGLNLTHRSRRWWLPVRRRVVGGDWHALRCAVHARPPHAAQPKR